ncbi:hypothetical protein B0H13DRAFT_2286571 [Mycena leptocephala]|nr:hypothetical protein B0H13DRAFT_2286571 [Mycena leptocephala]
MCADGVLPDSRTISAEGRRRVAALSTAESQSDGDIPNGTPLVDVAAMGTRAWTKGRHLGIWTSGGGTIASCVICGWNEDSGARSTEPQNKKAPRARPESEESGRMRIRGSHPKIRRRVRYADTEMRMQRSGWNEDEEWNGCRECGDFRFESSQTGGLSFRRLRANNYAGGQGAGCAIKGGDYWTADLAMNGEGNTAGWRRRRWVEESAYAPDASFGDGASSWWNRNQRKEEKNMESLKESIGLRSTSKDQGRLDGHSMGQAR